MINNDEPNYNSEKNKICEKCNCSNSIESKYCINCGNGLKSNNDVKENYKDQNNNKKDNRKALKVFCTISSIIEFILLVGVVCSMCIPCTISESFFAAMLFISPFFAGFCILDTYLLLINIISLKNLNNQSLKIVSILECIIITMCTLGIVQQLLSCISSILGIIISLIEGLVFVLIECFCIKKIKLVENNLYTEKYSNKIKKVKNIVMIITIISSIIITIILVILSHGSCNRVIPLDKKFFKEELGEYKVVVEKETGYSPTGLECRSKDIYRTIVFYDKYNNKIESGMYGTDDLDFAKEDIIEDLVDTQILNENLSDILEGYHDESVYLFKPKINNKNIINNIGLYVDIDDSIDLEKIKIKDFDYKNSNTKINVVVYLNINNINDIQKNDINSLFNSIYSRTGSYINEMSVVTKDKDSTYNVTYSNGEFIWEKPKYYQH